MKRFFPLAVIVLAFLAAGCSQFQQAEKERAAIESALQKYLSERSGLNLTAMNWEIKEFNTDRDRANLKVIFTAKEGGATMIMDYELRKENGVWAVKKGDSRGASGMAHPGTDAGPTPAAPPAGAGKLPPGHPPLTPQPQAPAKVPTAPKKSS
jgi:hypothetical protein